MCIEVFRSPGGVDVCIVCPGGQLCAQQHVQGGGGGVDMCNGDALHMSLPCIVHNHGANVSTVVWSGASGKKQLKNLARGEGRPRIASLVCPGGKRNKQRDCPGG